MISAEEHYEPTMVDADDPATDESPGEAVRAHPQATDVGPINLEECVICDELQDHVDALYRMGFSLTRNAKDAEDLVQETFMRAVRKHHRFKLGTNLRGWLVTILKNAFINRYRRDRARPGQIALTEVEPFLAEQSDNATPQFSVLDGVGADRLHEGLDDAVSQALLNLPDEFREILLLSVVEGLAYKEIAALLNIPIGTVMSRLFRARKHLQHELSGFGREMGWLPEDADHPDGGGRDDDDAAGRDTDHE